MPNNYIAGFDPVAMGLEKIMQGGSGPSSPETGQATEEGTQTGWYKYLGDRKQQQYDMQGNPTRIFENPGLGSQVWNDVGKKAVVMGATALTMGGLAGAGPLAGMLGGGATSAAVGTETFVSSAGVFGANAAPLSFEALGGAMAVPEIAGVTAAEMGGAAAAAGAEGFRSAAQQMTNFSLEGSAAPNITSVGSIPQGLSIAEQQAALLHAGADMGGSSTLGTLTGSGYMAPTAGSLTSGMTAGGATAGLGNVAAGVAAGVGEYGGVTGALSTFAGINPAAIAANPGASNWFTSTFGEAGVAGWIKSNPELSKLLFATVGGAVAAIGASSIADKNNQNRIDVANIAATNNLDVMKLKDQQTQDANKRYSASVSGINYGGLINSTPKPLTRNDGTRVFSGNGLINRG